MAYPVIWTTAGENAVVNAQEDGFAPVRIAAIGLSPTAVAGEAAAIAALTALPAQSKLLTAVGGELANDALIHVTMTDESFDAYVVRAVGIYSDDDVLLAVYSQPTPIVEKVAAVQLLFAFDLPIITSVAPGTIVVEGTGFSVPPATTVLRGVVELATPTETRAGLDAERAVTPVAHRHAQWRTLFLSMSH